MWGILLLAGVALIALALVLLIASLAATRPPREAAIAFVFGLAAVGAAAWISPKPLDLGSVPEAWSLLKSGNLVR